MSPSALPQAPENQERRKHGTQEERSHLPPPWGPPVADTGSVRTHPPREGIQRAGRAHAGSDDRAPVGGPAPVRPAGSGPTEPLAASPPDARPGAAPGRARRAHDQNDCAKST